MIYNISVREDVSLPEDKIVPVTVCIFKVNAQSGQEACHKLLNSQEFLSLGGNPIINNIWTEARTIRLDNV